MFKSISHRRYDDGNYIYLLKDTDFVCEVAAPRIAALGGMVAAALEYEKRHLPVAKNICLMYLYFYGISVSSYVLEKDREIIDKYYPELKYSEKYFNCVKNKVRMKLFAYNKSLK